MRRVRSCWSRTLRERLLEGAPRIVARARRPLDPLQQLVGAAVLDHRAQRAAQRPRANAAHDGGRAVIHQLRPLELDRLLTAAREAADAKSRPSSRAGRARP